MAEKNPAGINTGNPLENTICPVSLSRLDELYWREAQSTQQIADYLTNMYCHKYYDVVVLKWLHKADIPVRTRGHGYSVRAKQTPEIYQNAVIIANRASVVSENKKPLPSKIWQKIQEKGRAVEKARRESMHVKLRCEYCNMIYSRPPYKIKGKKHYLCSKECSVPFYERERKFAKLRAPYDAILAQREQQAKELFGEYYTGSQEELK